MLNNKFFIILFLVFQASFSQLTPITKNTKVSILTVGAANESHSLYGHTAIRINDATTDFDFIYNYGMFDFNIENFILKFVKGDMKYFAAAYPYQDFEYSYRIENRSIYEQVLNLSLEEKQILFEKLNKTLAEKSKYYTYKFIDRNCTTKAIDVVNEVLQNHPIIKQNVNDKTYRDVLFPYVKNQFYQKLGINIIFGLKVDQKATKLFLPFDFYENLQKTDYKNKPLVTETKTLFKAIKIENNFSFLDSIYSLCLLLLLILIVNSKMINVIYFSILGLIGLFFTLIGLYSFHQEVLWNYNVLLFNPIYLILSYFIIKNNQNGIKKTVLVALVCLGLYVVNMINKIHLYIILPFVITNLLLLIFVLKKLLTSIK